ncbi:MAG: hypothetical protein EBY17_24565 [Acidobacteriia bacterium]|nr:hypothetical protein [Terriglobia bacterium]
MLLTNYIFGGSITARLPDRIRNQEGLSYSVNSTFAAPAEGKERPEGRSQLQRRTRQNRSHRLHRRRSSHSKESPPRPKDRSPSPGTNPPQNHPGPRSGRTNPPRGRPVRHQNRQPNPSPGLRRIQKIHRPNQSLHRQSRRLQSLHRQSRRLQSLRSVSITCPALPNRYA